MPQKAKSKVFDYIDSFYNRVCRHSHFYLPRSLALRGYDVSIQESQVCTVNPCCGMHKLQKDMQSKKDKMQVQLLAVSPVAFMLAREGDKASVKRTPPKPNEYRDKIGPATEAFLVFKGETKIGMIPREFIEALGEVTLKKLCRIDTMDRELNLVLVELFPQDTTAL